MSRKTKSPTAEQYTNLQAAYDYFNEVLFDKTLADCIITLRSHGKRTLGLFHAEQWQHGADTCHEIALSPAHLRRPVRDVFGTLVHEMCHLWQQDHGKPSRSGYHNREWGTKMKEIGLHPSHTGEPGGKEVGQQMTHYIVEGGPFDVAVDAMPDSVLLPWVGVEPVEKEKKSSNKVKYHCPTCDVTAWGKGGILLLCGNCEEELEAQE
jgi:hypothetical protein